jgi:hypothetical protein
MTCYSCLAIAGITLHADNIVSAQVFAAAIPAQLKSLEQALNQADVSSRAPGSDMDAHRQQVSYAAGR